MRFLLGVLIGYSLRGKKKLLITIIAMVVLIVYVILPTIALVTLFDVEHERKSRPTQTKVPTIKGLSYNEAETKLHASNLNIRLLATRYDLPLQAGLIIDQVPQPGEQVDYGYPVGVIVTKTGTP